MRRAVTPWKRWTLTLLFGLAGALGALWLNIPVPWMIGPVTATALLQLSGLDLSVPPPARPFGQWAIGTGLGLYFTPVVFAELLHYAPAILVGATFALILGTLTGRVLAKLAGIDAGTAYFAAMPGGASEMVNLAERFGSRVDRVAAAHSLRIILVVLVVPAAFVLSGVHGFDNRGLAHHSYNPMGLLALALASAAGAMAWRRLNQPNPWVVGPLLVVAALTGAGVELSSLPHAISAVGQLCIGVSLGCRFTPEFFRTAPRFVAAVMITTVGMLVIAAGFGALLGWLSGLPIAPVVLGTAPGGIAEMCITAQALQLGVPLVTSFHVIRMLAVVVLCGPLYVRLSRHSGTAS
jgi:membrane AbrB-like protein